MCDLEGVLNVGILNELWSQDSLYIVLDIEVLTVNHDLDPIRASMTEWLNCTVTDYGRVHVEVYYFVIIRVAMIYC